MEDKTLPTLYSQFIHLSRYAKWIEDQNRRETWVETVDRYVDYMFDVQCAGKMPPEVKQEVRQAILNQEVMPSMRCMMTAGKALEIDNVAAFNCSMMAINHPYAFDELLYILMCGTGCGISVERQYIVNMPVVAEKLRPCKSTIVVEDSRIGWANALREFISLLYAGRIPEWDVSRVRPAGAKLKTFGGRASGPAPLVDLFKFLIETFKASEGRRLNSLECHDICCKIAEVVIAGGVRRSAILSLTNPSDDRMRYAKSGNWADTTPWRAMANISAAYTEKPGMDVFFREWMALYESKSGERGIFNREAAKAQAVKYGRRDPNHDFLCNPCSEILARDMGLCNLSEVIIRPEDNLESLMRKMRIASIIGTMQATLLDFRYLRPEWRKNAQEEALLGVSPSGIMDNELMSGRKGKRELADTLDQLRQHVVNVNKEWAKVLGINPAAATTCVKPSGTSSQLNDCSSGIHARFAKTYVRRVRCDNTDPISMMMVDMGFPVEKDFYNPDHLNVFSFPMKAPVNAVTTDDLTALDQLELWRIYQNHWAEHKVSMTVYVGETEWMEVGAWVYRHFDTVSGIAFLPRSEHTYKQTPFEAISDKDYDELLSKMPKSVDWSKITEYEKEDSTTNQREIACSAGKCELT